jgi:hypothetical protein
MSAAFDAIQRTITDPQERAQINELGARLGLSPNSPEWAILALNLSYNQRLAATFAEHETNLQRQTELLLDALPKHLTQVLAQGKTDLGSAALTARQKLTDDLAPIVEKALSRATQQAATSAIASARETLLEASTKIVRGARDDFQAAAAEYRHENGWYIAALITLAFAVGGASIVMWNFGYRSGWTDARNRTFYSADQAACDMLNSARHELAAQKSNAHAVRVVMTKYGCALPK